MIRSRWWLVALGATGLGVFGFLIANGADAQRMLIAAVLVGAYSVLFLLLRPRACDGNTAALVLAGSTAVYAGALTAVEPTLAVAQCFAYPLVWVGAGARRSGVLAALGVGIAVGAGFWISLGGLPALPQILITQTLSFGFASIMGLWIWRIAELSDEKTRLLDELTATQGELAALHRDAGVTEERARLSREMHDTVAQSLTGLVLLSQRARRSFAAGTLDDDTLELIETGARDALAETRALVAAAAPVELDQGGIADALRRLAERFERETRIRVSVSTELAAPLDRDVEVVLLRCAQEGLANVRKHSDAATARVELAAASDTARLTVRDDGRGFPAEVHAGFGLTGLRDRLALVGGTLAVDGTPGATTITATLPLGGAA